MRNLVLLKIETSLTETQTSLLLKIDLENTGFSFQTSLIKIYFQVLRYLVCSIVQTAIAVLLSLLIMIATGKLVTSENNISKISSFLRLTALLTKFIKVKKYI